MKKIVLDLPPRVQTNWTRLRTLQGRTLIVKSSPIKNTFVKFERQQPSRILKKVMKSLGSEQYCHFSFDKKKKKKHCDLSFEIETTK